MIHRRDSLCAERDRGSVTAETAVVLPCLVLVLAAVLWGVAASAAQIRAIDAARTAAIALSRGESVETVDSIARQHAPAGATVTVSDRLDEVRVLVDARVSGPGPLARLLPALPVHAHATAQLESATWR